MKTILLIGLFFYSAFSKAEPMARGLMVNGNQCSKYWAGDECVYYKLPTGWSEVYPSGPSSTINHKEKTCQLEVGKEDACCKQLGLKFVSLKIERDLIKKVPEFCKNK